jgi:methyl-accepting chemotaxis protein
MRISARSILTHSAGGHVLQKLSIKNALRAFAALSAFAVVGLYLLQRVWGASDSVLLAAALACPAALFGVAWVLGHHFAKRAERVVGALHALAEGDLTRKLKIPGRDDFSWLAYEYDCARKGLVTLVAELKEHSRSVNEATAELGAASASISDGTDKQSDAAAGISSAVEELAVSVSQVADHAREARELSASAGDLSAEGKRTMDDVVGEVSGIADSVRASSGVVESLGQKSTNMRQIVKVIGDVAEQTNLLALNAAIEAARAGEQGRGFAVVADEVRKLAERTATSTREIGAMIESIYEGTRQAVSSMEASVGRVDGGVGLAQAAGARIGALSDNARSAATAVAEISAAIEQQRGASNDIARHVERIAQMAESTRGATRRTDETTRKLIEMSGRLAESAGRFKV